ncbi:hypothetical protein XENTR_v10001662 [Xenopus tropicalis]|nr:hypothetical protein XENTR_v10001662 [Xenopus tropicalis]
MSVFLSVHRHFPILSFHHLIPGIKHFNGLFLDFASDIIFSAGILQRCSQHEGFTVFSLSKLSSEDKQRPSPSCLHGPQNYLLTPRDTGTLEKSAAGANVLSKILLCPAKGRK